MKRANFPGRKQAKREEALKRNEAWRAMSAAEQEAALNEKLGQGVGARRQRAKIQPQQQAA